MLVYWLHAFIWNTRQCIACCFCYWCSIDAKFYNYLRIVLYVSRIAVAAFLVPFELFNLWLLSLFHYEAAVVATSAALFVWIGWDMTGIFCMATTATVGTTGLHVIRACTVLVAAAAVCVPAEVCTYTIATSNLEGRGGEVTVNPRHIP